MASKISQQVSGPLGQASTVAHLIRPDEGFAIGMAAGVLCILAVLRFGRKRK